MKPISEIPT